MEAVPFDLHPRDTAKTKRASLLIAGHWHQQS